MIIHTQYEQGSVEWMQARAGIPTASEFDQLLTPKLAIRTGDMVESYLAKKLAERWLGGPLADFNTFDMDQGQILEQEARPWFEFTYGLEVQRIPFATTDDGRVGCSPDGMFADGTGLEIKCPQPHTHIGYLLDGKLPAKYAAQVHGSMFVTGAKSWRFLSYCRRMPALLITVERDDDIQDIIREALESFCDLLDAGMAHLERLNGGPPKRPVFSQPKRKPEFDENENDVVTP